MDQKIEPIRCPLPLAGVDKEATDLGQAIAKSIKALNAAVLWCKGDAVAEECRIAARELKAATSPKKSKKPCPSGSTRG